MGGQTSDEGIKKFISQASGVIKATDLDEWTRWFVEVDFRVGRQSSAQERWTQVDCDARKPATEEEIFASHSTLSFWRHEKCPNDERS